MNILDENISESQRQLARSWRLRVHQIGFDIGRQGMRDEEIIPLLHHLPQPISFTRDLGFYDRRLCHANYCLVCLVLGQGEVATFIRRFLQHPAFRTRAKRLGNVVRVSHQRMTVWRVHAVAEADIAWLPKGNA
jgi:hypothetical protein